MPTGHSDDPSPDSDGPDETFCNYKQPAWNAPTVIDWRAAGLLTTPAQRWRGNGGQR
jgi:hypothetical protein